MEDEPSRGHRGPHPEDSELFATARWPALQAAADDVAWLLGRGYTMDASVALVGNRFQLAARQRLALKRSVCSEAQREHRWRREVEASAVAGRALAIDGFNLLMTVEAAMAGGTLLLGRDGNIRNLAPLHGSYRPVAETDRAIAAIGAALGALRAGPTAWLLDKPVSNSGRLKATLSAAAAAAGWVWTVELVADVDGALSVRGEVVVTSDAVILDACGMWLNLAGLVIARGGEVGVVDAFGAPSGKSKRSRPDPASEPPGRRSEND